MCCLKPCSLPKVRPHRTAARYAAGPDTAPPAPLEVVVDAATISSHACPDAARAAMASKTGLSGQVDSSYRRGLGSRSHADAKRRDWTIRPDETKSSVKTRKSESNRIGSMLRPGVPLYG